MRGQIDALEGRQFGGRGQSTKVYSYCGNNDLLVDACYKKHGYLLILNQELELSRTIQQMKILMIPKVLQPIFFLRKLLFQICHERLSSFCHEKLSIKIPIISSFK